MRPGSLALTGRGRPDPVVRRAQVEDDAPGRVAGKRRSGGGRAAAAASRAAGRFRPDAQRHPGGRPVRLPDRHPLVPEQEKPLLRAQMAQLGYKLADPATWSIERGYMSGNPDMSVSHVLGLGMIGCTIPDHLQPTIWQFWTRSERLVPSSSGGGEETGAQTARAVEAVLPLRELAGDRFTAVGQHGIGLEHFVAAPRGTPRHTSRYGTSYTHPIPGYSERQDLLDLAPRRRPLLRGALPPPSRRPGAGVPHPRRQGSARNRRSIRQPSPGAIDCGEHVLHSDEPATRRF